MTPVQEVFVFLVDPDIVMMEIRVPTIPAMLQLENVYTLLILLLVTMEMLVQWMMYAIMDVVHLDLPKIVMILMSVPMIVAILTLEIARTPTIGLHVTMATLVHCTMFVTMASALLVILESAMMRISVPTTAVITKQVVACTPITMLPATMEMLVQ